MRPPRAPAIHCFLTHAPARPLCFLVGTAVPTDVSYVVVGDSPNKSSAQFQYTRKFDDGIPTFTSPTVADSHAMKLLKIEPVTFDGFFPATIRNSSSDPTALYVGQTLTVAGYGTVLSNRGYPGEAFTRPSFGWSASRTSRSWRWPPAGRALATVRATTTTPSLKKCALIPGSWPHPIVHSLSAGDGGVPIFDRSLSLFGFVVMNPGAFSKQLVGVRASTKKSIPSHLLWEPFFFGCVVCGSGGNNNLLSNFVRVSPFSDWITRNVCALSDMRETLPSCPDLVCPRDARIAGYPWAALPNATGSVLGIRGFHPVIVTQWPPPDTPLWRNTTNNVTITAEDAVGRQLSCTWLVHVPPLEVVGTIFVDVPETLNGTATRSGRFSRSGGAGIGGRVYKLSGRTSDQVRGAGSSIRAGLRKGSDKYTGTLRLQENHTKGSVVVPSVPIRYGWDSFTSDVDVDVLAERLAQANTLTLKAYGQILEQF
jgi:hypothetical protein